MRSHILNQYVPSKTEQLSQEGEEDSVSSSSDEENEENGLKNCELNGKTKKNIDLVISDFSFVVDAGSVVLQDRESETESSKNPIQRRSKRIRKLENSDKDQQQCFKKSEIKKPEFGKVRKTETSLSFEQEPVSSISVTTTEEGVAYCLMMLSRDKWNREENDHEQHEDNDEKEAEAEKEKEVSNGNDCCEDDSDLLQLSKTSIRGKYKCETCNKVFRSYQALGGHIASHKKFKASSSFTVLPPQKLSGNGGSASRHKCPICNRVFPSGQALGGHKRSHVVSSSTTTTTASPSTPKSLSKAGEMLIDLNLPAPMDDEDEDVDTIQAELSAVSDADFVNPANK